MPRGRHSNVTIRSGTGERNWYVLAGYLAFGILGIIYFLVILQQGFGDSAGSNAAGLFGGVVVLGLSLGGLVIYPALFKDAAYVNDTRRRWSPQWWYYLLGGLGTPLAIYFILAFGMPGTLAFAGAMMTHAVSATVVSAVYLYRRHQYLGVP